MADPEYGGRTPSSPGQAVRSNTFSGQSYRFPETNIDEYKGRISFVAREQKEASRVVLERLEALSEYASSINLADDPAVDPIVARAQAAINRARLTDPSLITRTASETPRGRPTGKVVLYLPTALQFVDGVSYADADLGIPGGAAVRFMQGGMQNAAGLLEAALTGGLISAGQQAYGLYSGTSDLTQGAAVAVARLVKQVPFVGEQLADAASTELGVTVNPNRRSALRSVATRRFTFVFKLIPSNQAESIAIRNIIGFFRENMYPINVVDPATNILAGYTYPSKFDIKLSYNNKNVATGILPCFLENVSTTYNPNSMSFHANSSGDYASPTEVDLSLTFVEERTLSRDDVRNGY